MQQSRDFERGIPTAEGFECLWANREGARRLELALPPPSRDTLTLRRASVRNLWGTLLSTGQELRVGTLPCRGFPLRVG